MIFFLFINFNYNNYLNIFLSQFIFVISALSRFLSNSDTFRDEAVCHQHFRCHSLKKIKLFSLVIFNKKTTPFTEIAFLPFKRTENSLQDWPCLKAIKFPLWVIFILKLRNTYIQTGSPNNEYDLESLLTQVSLHIFEIP